MSSIPSPARNSFSALRLAVGVLSWAAPNTAERVFGLPRSSEPFATRLFGAREVALALGLQAEPELRRRTLQAGIVIDSVDALGGAIDYLRGRLNARAFVLGPGGAVAFVVLGAAALAEHDREQVG